MTLVTLCPILSCHCQDVCVELPRLIIIYGTNPNLPNCFKQQLLSRMNKLGITQSPWSKLQLLDKCAEVSETQIVEALKKNPVCKITGDNLDVFVRTQHQSSDKQHKDMHLFTSNIIISRLPIFYSEGDICDVRPKDLDIKPEHFILSATERGHLLDSYAVLVGRMMCKHLVAFKWLESVLPQHMKHTLSEVMQEKSKVFPLPILMKNESRYEDCVDILDSYEDQLISLYTKAHGNTLESL